jgi:hypothetical protein
MDLLKTPHQMLLEEAGATPQSDGLLKTPKQMLFEESGMLPHYAAGHTVKQLSPKEMQAALVAHELRQKYAQGGDVHPTLAAAFNKIFS